jgi:hypothetical protein
LLGVAPMLYLLQQAQGGFAVSSWETAGDEDSFVLTRPGSEMAWDPATGEEGWPTARSEMWTIQGDRVIGDFGLNRYEYRFENRELQQVQVEQFGRDIPPDLSRPFTGQAESRFRMDINGQRGHGAGIIRASWNDDQVELQIIPDSPWWLADRPMHGVIVFPAPGMTESWMQRSRAPE